MSPEYRKKKQEKSKENEIFPLQNRIFPCIIILLFLDLSKEKEEE